MSNLMAALFPEGRESLVCVSTAAEVAACLSALAEDPRARELLAAQASPAVQAGPEDGFWPAPGHWMNAYRPYVVAAGVLQIPVKGILLADLSFTVGNFATGYAYIRRALARGVADPEVKGIALIANTPGGEVRDCFELGDQIAAARVVKPVRGFAHDHAYSAGYLLVSAATRVVISRTGGVGSIGVVTSHIDATAALEKSGLKITFVFAGKHKVDSYSAVPLSDDAKARMQARIDELMGVFVEAVARNRAMKPEAVRATEALTYTASQAIKVGLADEIGSLQDAVAAFAADLTTDPEDETMATYTQEQMDAALAAARTEATAAATSTATAAATAAATTAANERFVALMADDRSKGRERAAVALAAGSPAMTADAVLAFVAEHAAAPAPASSRLDGRVPDPNLSADGDASKKPTPEAGLAAAVDRMVAGLPKLG